MLTRKHLQSIGKDPKAFLKRAYRLDEQIEARLERIERLRSKLENPTASMKEIYISHTGPTNSLEEGVLDIIELEESIENLKNIPREIEEALELLIRDSDLKLVLELRYLNHYFWDEIAEKMCYTRRWVQTLHDKGIEQLQKESALVPNKALTCRE